MAMKWMRKPSVGTIQTTSMNNKLYHNELSLKKRGGHILTIY